MVFLKTNRIAAAVSVGIMLGLALTGLMASKFLLHSQVVALNLYANGAADYTVDATMFLKTVCLFLFVAFATGLGLGTLVNRRQ